MQTGKNPYTNTPLSMTDIETNFSLQNEINNFVAKVTLVKQCFSTTYDKSYLKYKEQICGPMLLEDFERVLMSPAAQTQPDKISTRAAIIKNQNLNPLKLYQSAIENYKNKNFEAAAPQLQQALVLFETKTSKDSIECFKCYSTLISCYREIKDYKAAIAQAEQAIDIFFDKIELAPLIKKFDECLKLSQSTLETLYEQAVSNYKSKQYSVALHRLLFITSNFDPNTKKTELASSHSTLASCYRELKMYDLAITHCKRALELRKESLDNDHNLIQETEKKLLGLQKLLSDTSPSNIMKQTS